MIRSAIQAILSPVVFVLLGAGLVTMAVVTPEPEPTPQIIIIEVTPEPTPTVSPTPTSTPLLPSVDPLPSLLPSVEPLPSLIPLPIPLPTLPPLPPAPVCDRESQGMHKGWENSGRECSGPNPLGVGLVIVVLLRGLTWPGFRRTHRA